ANGYSGNTHHAKAKRQVRLLNAVERGWRPTGKKAQPKTNRYTKLLSGKY
ncbi:hypothetical protein LCGC14_2850110, partial [marine sediment metagenome]